MTEVNVQHEIFFYFKTLKELQWDDGRKLPPNILTDENKVQNHGGWKKSIYLKPK